MYTSEVIDRFIEFQDAFPAFDKGTDALKTAKDALKVSAITFFTGNAVHIIETEKNKQARAK